MIDFIIPASQAFGTGQHATTAGCLAMLSADARARRAVVRNAVDVGTGTGLLAFAALALWPRALMTASDIDAVCAERDRRQRPTPTASALGARRGELTPVIAPGSTTRCWTRADLTTSLSPTSWPGR